MEPEREVYVVEGPGGFTESFNKHTVDVLTRMGLIKHVESKQIMLVGPFNQPNGPMHHFYVEATR